MVPNLSDTASAPSVASPKRLLVVSVTNGYRHDCIPVGERLVAELAARTGEFTLDHARTDDELAAKASPQGLVDYDGALFLNTAGHLPIADPQALVDWVAAGHGFIGAHAAADTYHDFPPYIDMLGSEFQWHGQQVPATILVAGNDFPGFEGAGSSIEIPIEEMYVLKNFLSDQVRLLLYMDHHPNENTPGLFPLTYARRFGLGRVFYTGLGHRDDVWTAPWFGEQLLGGIRYALGLAPADDAPRPLPQVG